MLTGSEIIILSVDEAKQLLEIIQESGVVFSADGLKKLGGKLDVYVRLREIVRYHSGEL